MLHNSPRVRMCSKDWQGGRGNGGDEETVSPRSQAIEEKRRRLQTRTTTQHRIYERQRRWRWQRERWRWHVLGQRRVLPRLTAAQLGGGRRRLGGRQWRLGRVGARRDQRLPNPGLIAAVRGCGGGHGAGSGRGRGRRGGRARRARRPEEKEGGAVGEDVAVSRRGRRGPSLATTAAQLDQVRPHREQVRNSFICTVQVCTVHPHLCGFGNSTQRVAAAGMAHMQHGRGGRRGFCAAAAVSTYMTASGSWKGGGAAGLRDGRGCREGQGGGHSGASSPGSNRHLPPPAVPYE